MASPIVLISIFPVANAPDALWDSLVDDDLTRYLASPDRRELLQLRGYDGPAAVAAATGVLDADVSRFAPYMTGDVRRELLRYVETPRPTASDIATTCNMPVSDTSLTAAIDSVRDSIPGRT